MEAALGDLLQREGLSVNPLTPRIPAALLKSAKATVAPHPLAAPKTPPRVSGMLVRFADAAVNERARRNEPPPAELAAQVLALSGQRLVYARAMALGHHVFEFTAPAELQQAQELAARLRASAAVAQVELDVRARTRALPNDPYFSLQRSLQAPAGQPGAIDAVGAWQITTGSAATVIAILDTGITNHAEFAGRVLPGFDFLSSRFQANDGDSRDGNAAKPGHLGDGQRSQRAAAKSPIRSDRTHVAGIAAARGNNGYGIAGVDWNTRILPVRVLGKCGGSLSDVIDGTLGSRASRCRAPPPTRRPPT